MAGELDDVADTLQATRDAHRAAVDATRTAQHTPTNRPRGLYMAGDRVFDAVAGVLGTVTSATDFGRPLLASVVVELDTGDTVTRRPADLVHRPATPTPKG